MDRYRVDKVVGKGSFGQAILCSRIADGKACIVKQVDTSKLPAKARREASKEATLLAKLSHPNIVGFWESFLHGPSRDVLCIVMDYADGGDLSSCLRRRNGRLLDEEVVLDWFVQTTLALKHIHDRKILHRDLKTQNIFLTRSRVVKLGDFGIAKVLGSTLDLARTCIGTPYYMSPEICQEKRYNHKSDMWSLGCVLYEMTCLRHAFDGTNMRLLVMKICAQEPRPISARYSSGVRGLIAQLLKKDPHARPSTGAVLRRPLIKDKIGRFLSEAQIKEEFNHGVSPGHQPSSSSSAAASPSIAAAAAAAARSPPAGAGGAIPRWPFHGAGVSRPRPEAASPGLRGRGRAIVAGGAGVGAGVGVGAGGNVSRAAKAGEGRGRAAADERRRAEALARKKEVRAAARERGQLAAVALNIAKPSLVDRRSAATPKRPSSAEDAAAAARRKPREARPPEERPPDPDSKRARERAEVARAALGIGGRRPSRRRASQPDDDAKVQTPRRPSAVSPPPGGGDSVARGGGGDDGRVFQHLQNARGGGGGGGSGGSSSGGGGVEHAAQEARRPGGGGRPGEASRGGRAAGVAGAASMREEMDEALELARRRRAARAVFGPGFGAQDDDGDGNGDGDERSARRAEAEDGRSGLEAKSSGPNRSSPGAQNPAASPSCRADVKLSAETGERLPPPESRQATDQQQQQQQRHHDRRGDEAATPLDAKDDGDRKQGMLPADEDARKSVDEDGRRLSGQTRQQQGTVPEIVPQTIPARAEQKRPGEGKEEKDTASGLEQAAIDIGGGEEKGVARGPFSDFPDEVDSSDVAGGGRDEARSKVDLGVTDGWFRKFEAKMGAIKKQVGEIKSPPFSTPQRSGGDRHGYPASKRDEADAAAPLSYRTPPPRDHNDGASSLVAAGKNDEEKAAWPADGGPPVARCFPCHLQQEEEGNKQTTASQAGGDRRQGGEERDNTRRSGGSSSPEAGGVGEGASRSAAALRRCTSQQMARLSAAAAAVETAAAAVAAIPVNASSNARAPEPGGPSGHGVLIGESDPGAGEDDHRADDPVERPGGGGGGSGLTTARPSPVGGAGGVKVAMTPASRGSGGRVARKAPPSGWSERKPPSASRRHAAALAAELERHSESRRRKKSGKGAGSPSGDDEELGGSIARTPSAEERGQALRATRDRERAQLRAMIAQKRQKAANTLKDGGGGGSNDGDGDEESLNGGAPCGDLVEPLLLQQEWGSPRNRAAAAGGGRPPATEPPPRPPARLRRTPPHRAVAVAAVPGGKEGGVCGARSVDASRRRRRPRVNNCSGSSKIDDGEGEVDARAGRQGALGVERDPANRHQSLRDFIAESRRNRRNRQSDNSLDDQEISVVVAPGGGPGGGAGGFSAAAATPPEEEESDAQVVSDEDEVAADAAGPRRNIGREFDEEEALRAGPGNGQARGRREGGAWGRGHAPKCGAPEVVEGGSVVEEEKDGRGGNVDRGSSRASSRSPSSSSPRREQFREDDVMEGEAVGAMEGVHPGLATYDSQRSAAGMDGGGRTGQEEYARMLELMQKEVLELGDGASTDSGWGGSASSSAEEKSSSGRERERERDGDHDDDERSTGSSNGGGGDGDVVSGSELAVFLFQGGVVEGSSSSRRESGAAFEAKDDNNDPSTASRGQAAARSPGLRPSVEDGFFEYSGSGCEGSSGQAPGDLGGSYAGGKATTRERGDRAVSGQEEDAAAADGVDSSERREAVADRGARSSSLTGELRGVDFVSVPVPVSTLPKGAAEGASL